MGYEIVSWNLQGLEERHLDERTEAQIMIALLGDDALESTDAVNELPDALLFQEVVARSFHAHLRPHLLAAGYSIFPEAPPEHEYFEMIALSRDWQVDDAAYTPFPMTRMHRGLTLVAASRAGNQREPMTFATAHLESMREGAREREIQAKLVAAVLQENAPAVFAGDTNLRNDEALDLAATDAFVQFGSPRGQGTTWRTPDKKRGYRFDRMWLDEKSPFVVENWRTSWHDALSDHALLRVRLTAAS